MWSLRSICPKSWSGSSRTETWTCCWRRWRSVGRKSSTMAPNEGSCSRETGNVQSRSQFLLDSGSSFWENLLIFGLNSDSAQTHNSPLLPLDKHTHLMKLTKLQWHSTFTLFTPGLNTSLMVPSFSVTMVTGLNKLSHVPIDDSNVTFL